MQRMGVISAVCSSIQSGLGVVKHYTADNGADDGAENGVGFWRARSPSPLKSPTTVMCQDHPPTHAHTSAHYCRALTRVYLELCKHKVLDYDVDCYDLRLVNAPCFDAYAALATACAFVDVMLSSCCKQNRDAYFESMTGRFCITSVFMLTLKFCKSDSFARVVDGQGKRASVASMVFIMLFGKLDTFYNNRYTVDLLWETEAYLMERMGGRLFSFFRNCTASVAEGLLEAALETAEGKAERDAVLKCRNVMVVYATSMYAVDRVTEPVLAAAVRSGVATTAFLANVAALIATASLVAAGIELPGSIKHLYETTDSTSLMFAMWLLNHCRVNAREFPLVIASRRDLLCGPLFAERVQTTATQTLLVRSQALTRARLDELKESVEKRLQRHPDVADPVP